MDASQLPAANNSNHHNEALTLPPPTGPVAAPPQAQAQPQPPSPAPASAAAPAPAPAASNVNGTPRMAVPKDKQCKYCSQTFTSSSLGRHLDQYLFKKKPDGLHNIDEIRQLRSHITRRTPRSASSGTWRNVASPSTSTARSVTVGSLDTARRFSHQGHAPQPNPATPLPAPALGRNNDGSMRTPSSSSWLVNQGPWRSDVPGSGNALMSAPQPAQSSAEFNARQRQGGGGSAADRQSASVSNRALELALHEVLDNVKAATLRVQRRVSPFDFDLQSQNFPSLCLRTLPPPPTILSSNPFPSSSSFTIEPPSVHQKELIQATLKDHIEKWKAEQLSLRPVYANNGSSGSGNAVTNDPEMIERTAKQHEEMILRHVDLSLNAWELMAPEMQRHQWHLEIIRALALESDQRKKLEEQLAHAQQSIVRLQSQLEKINMGQWPREFYIAPPDIPPLPVDVARELGGEGRDVTISGNESKWDYENLVAKWKRVVAHDRNLTERAPPIDVSLWGEHEQGTTTSTDAAAAAAVHAHLSRAHENQYSSVVEDEPQQKRRRLAGDNENHNLAAPVSASAAPSQPPYVFAPPHDSSQQQHQQQQPPHSSLSLRPVSPNRPPASSSPQRNTHRDQQQPSHPIPPPYSMQDSQTGSPAMTPSENVSASERGFSSEQAQHLQQQQQQQQQQQSEQSANATVPDHGTATNTPEGEIQ